MVLPIVSDLTSTAHIGRKIIASFSHGDGDHQHPTRVTHTPRSSEQDSALRPWRSFECSPTNFPTRNPTSTYFRPLHAYESIVDATSVIFRRGLLSPMNCGCDTVLLPQALNSRTRLHVRVKGAFVTCPIESEPPLPESPLPRAQRTSAAPRDSSYFGEG